MINVDLDKPITILDPLYPAAVVHALIQRRDGVDTNLYTTVIHVSDDDARSVPTAGDETVLSESDGFVVLRHRVSKADAAAFIAAAASGLATIAGRDVAYDVFEPELSFRASGGIAQNPRPSLIGVSTWGRERLARAKALDGVVSPPEPSPTSRCESSRSVTGAARPRRFIGFRKSLATLTSSGRVR